MHSADLGTLMRTVKRAGQVVVPIIEENLLLEILTLIP
jgi:hypothetical protein